MERSAIRRSGRIALEIPIRVTGTDSAGRPFTEKTQTLGLSQFGAKIFLRIQAYVEQEVVVRHLQKEKEAAARIVWVRGLVAGGYHCGIEFLDPETDMWEIDFSAHDLLEGVTARLLLECPRCHVHQVFAMDAFEVENFQRTGCLARHCSRCRGVVFWRFPS